MEFIDHTGHIFSMKDWSSYPVGYEYNINDYVFWLDSNVSSHKLSIKNFYIQPIRFIASSIDANISIKLKESDKFALLSASKIQEKIENNESIFDEITIEDDLFSNELGQEDLCLIDNISIDGRKEKCTIGTFYIVGYSGDEGTWMTDVLINDDDIYCPITVGGEFHMESSELIVNGQNMGITLPKDILNSLYDIDLLNDVPDEAYLSLKLKEIMLNYMHIKGECGNYESAKDSLNWFGYGKLIEIRQLLQTDNQFVLQYVHDNFDVSSDNGWSWKNFRRSSGYAIWMNINRYLDEEERYEYDEEIIGEGKPKTEDLFNKFVCDVFDEKDIKFWRPYYNWSLQDMYIKMSMIEYYWKKYFLPIAFTISSASMKHHCFINDIKHVVKSSVSVSETPTWIGDSDTYVKFGGERTIYLFNQEAYFDSNYNEFSNSKEIGETTEEDVLYINDVCARIPLYFGCASDHYEDFYDVTLVLTRNGKKIYSSSFNFFQRKNDESYKNFILIPKSLVKHFNYSYWVNQSYRLAICCNGNWFYNDFILKVPEFQLKLGTLEYQYVNYTESKELFPGDDGYIDPDDPRYEFSDEEKKTVNIQTIEKSLFTQVKSISDDEVEFNSFMYDPQLTEVNDVNFFDKLKYLVDSAESKDENTSNLGTTSSGSTLTINSFCKYLASKCYIYGVGLEKTQEVYDKGDSVVPVFRFNNGIRLGNLEERLKYKLKSFNVDVLFDVDIDNKYYAKLTLGLNDIDNNGIVKCDHLRSYSDIDDKTLILRKKEIGCPDPFINDDGTIDWEKTSIEFRKFYVDEHIRHTDTMVIRLVSSGEIELPNGRTYSFGGYKADGNPRIYQDISIKVGNLNDELCTMECNCPWKNECKYRLGNNGIKDYDFERKDDPAEDKKDEIMSEVVKTSLDNLISSYQQSIYIQNNKKYLNRIHVYDLYLTKMDSSKAKKLHLNVSKVKKLQYDSNTYDVQWISKDFWSQSKEMIELYRMFFNDDGSCKVSINDEDTAFNYDFYLMHDDSNWFVVLISQETEENIENEDDLNLPDNIEYEVDSNTRFILKRYRSSDRFLMNRMMFVEKYPVNHFKIDDLIVATIDNVKFPFIFDKTTKWSVRNLSLQNKSKPILVGNTNTMILSLYDDANNHLSGYYDIDVRYSVDGIVDHQQKKHTRILIS